MDHLVYNLWILRSFGGIFPKMGFTWYNFFKALILALQWSFNLASRFIDIIMWRRIFKLDKPPCTIL
jgi:hypothetical protein